MMTALVEIAKSNLNQYGVDILDIKPLIPIKHFNASSERLRDELALSRSVGYPTPCLALGVLSTHLHFFLRHLL